MLSNRMCNIDSARSFFFLNTDKNKILLNYGNSNIECYVCRETHVINCKSIILNISFTLLSQ